MKKYLLGLVAGFSLVLCGTLAQAQEGKLTIKCHPHPRNLNFFKQALKERILANIDLTKYEKPRVSLRMKLISLETQPIVENSLEIAGGLNLVSHDSPQGLAFTVSGEMRYDEECLYNYGITLTTKGRDRLFGNRISAKTTSQITIRAPMDGRFKKGDAIATPTATATATANSN